MRISSFPQPAIQGFATKGSFSERISHQEYKECLGCYPVVSRVNRFKAFPLVNGIQARVAALHAFRRAWPVVTLFSGCTLP